MTYRTPFKGPPSGGTRARQRGLWTGAIRSRESREPRRLAGTVAHSRRSPTHVPHATTRRAVPLSTCRRSVCSIAEDNVLIQNLLLGLLTKWGYDVVIARTGDEAWGPLTRAQL